MIMTGPWPPTSRQQAALRYIAGYQEAHDGISPKLEEIAAALGLRGRSSAFRLLAELEDRGWIRRKRRRARAIELLAGVIIPRAPNGAPVFHIPAERLPGSAK